MTDSPRRRNNRLVRAQNIKRLLLLVRDQEPVTLDTLVQQSSLSYPTVLGIIKQLEESSHVEKVAYAPPTGGRQAVLYGISRVARYVLGVHVNRKSVSISITNIRGGKIFQTTEHLSAGWKDGMKAADEVLALLDSVLHKTRVNKENFVRIGIAHPEALPETAQKLRSAFQSYFTQTIRTIPDRIVLNHLERQGYHISSLLTYIFVWFDDELSLSRYPGPAGPLLQFSPRTYFSHFTVMPDGVECSCGRAGCLHSYVGGEGLLNAYRQAGGAMEFPNQGANLFHLMLSESHKGDRAATQAVNQAVRMLAVALANVIKIEGVATIVLSGLFNSTDLHFKRELEQYITCFLPPEYPQKPQIILGTAKASDCAYATSLLLNQDYFERLNFDK
jgi:predicted NBD/HSP70 family sugar kinase